MGGEGAASSIVLPLGLSTPPSEVIVVYRGHRIRGHHGVRGRHGLRGHRGHHGHKFHGANKNQEEGLGYMARRFDHVADCGHPRFKHHHGRSRRRRCWSVTLEAAGAYASGADPSASVLFGRHRDFGEHKFGQSTDQGHPGQSHGKHGQILAMVEHVALEAVGTGQAAPPSPSVLGLGLGADQGIPSSSCRAVFGRGFHGRGHGHGHGRHLHHLRCRVRRLTSVSALNDQAPSVLFDVDGTRTRTYVPPVPVEEVARLTLD